MVPLVHGGPEHARPGVERQGHRVAEPGREHPVSRAVRVVLVDRRPSGVGARRRVRGRADRHVHLPAIRVEHQVAGPVVEATRAADVDAESLRRITVDGVAAQGQVDDVLRRPDRPELARSVREAHDRVVVSHVQEAAPEGQPVRALEVRGEDLTALGRAVCVCVPQDHDPAGAALGHQDVAARGEREPPRPVEAVGEDTDLEPGRHQGPGVGWLLHDPRDRPIPGGLEGSGELLRGGEGEREGESVHRPGPVWGPTYAGHGRRTAGRPLPGRPVTRPSS